jgi:drug/metabolite transporter (DMT)-like permease
VPINIFGFWRLLIASSIVFLIYKLKTSHMFNKNKKINTSKNINLRDVFLLIILGVIFFSHLWTFFYAAKNTKIANAMIIYSVNPIFTALGSYMFFSEKFSWKLFFSYLFAFAGILLIFSGGFEFNSSRFWGDGSALLSALLFAIYALLSKQLRQKFDNTLFASLVYLSTSLCFGITGLFMDQPFFENDYSGWVTILASVAIPTLMGHALFTYLMNHLSLNKMTLGKLIEPVIASIVSFLIFKEAISSTTVTSFVLIAFAVLLSFIPEKRRRIKEINQIQDAE